MRLTVWLYLFFLFIGLPCSFRLLQHLLSVYHLYGRIALTVRKALGQGLAKLAVISQLLYPKGNEKFRSSFDYTVRLVKVYQKMNLSSNLHSIVTQGVLAVDDQRHATGSLLGQLWAVLPTQVRADPDRREERNHGQPCGIR
jgi:hypothetical protein